MENDIKTKRKGYMSVSQKQQLIELLTEEHALRSRGKKNAQEWKRLKLKNKLNNILNNYIMAILWLGDKIAIEGNEIRIEDNTTITSIRNRGERSYGRAAEDRAWRAGGGRTRDPLQTFVVRTPLILLLFRNSLVHTRRGYGPGPYSFPLV
ncbi:hypothetical protein QTP88_028288 [Uroleucon formosanum]